VVQKSGGDVWSSGDGARARFSNPRRPKAESGHDVLGVYPCVKKRAAAKTFLRATAKYSRLHPLRRQIEKTSTCLGVASVTPSSPRCPRLLQGCLSA
jgi:hypothetical protein